MGAHTRLPNGKPHLDPALITRFAKFWQASLPVRVPLLACPAVREQSNL